MTVGQGLADARRNLGLSLAELCSHTGFSAEVLRAIEETDLPHLPSGIALKAAIRAYAAAVQLDEDAVVERYLDRLPILPNTADALTAFETEGDERGQRTGKSGLFVYESAYDPDSGAEAAPLVDRAGPALLLRAEPDRVSSSFVVAHDGGVAPVSLPGRPSRFPVAVLLLASALAVVAGYLLSARGDWWPRDRSSRTANRVVASDTPPAPQADPNVAHAVGPNTVPTPPAAAANLAEAPPPDVSPMAVQTKAAPRDKTAGRAATNRQAAPDPDPPVPTALIVVPGSRPTTQPSTATASPTAPPTSRELNGSFTVVAHDEASTAETDSNRVSYYLRLEQRGGQVMGSGYRVSTSGAEAASSQQSVTVRGTLTAERLTLNLAGQNREQFILYRAEDGAYRGRFRRSGAAAGETSVVTLSPKQAAR